MQATRRILAEYIYEPPPVERGYTGQTLYVTKTGTKYHRDGCRSLRKSRTPISLGDAKRKGYGPCKVCGPPG